jgi:regulator of cell morphogenesis and NO signaling
MMSATMEKTVRQIALEKPNAARVFEKLGIDYCCGGNRPLGEACAGAKLSVEEVWRELEAAEQAGQSSAELRDWQSGLLADLAEYIVAKHHKYTREELARLEPLFEKVCSVHGKNHPELLHVRGIFRGLSQELVMHMMKEEMVLFPFVRRMEEAVLQGEPVLPAPFGTVRNPIQTMEHEHDAAGEALRAMREATRGYEPPPDSCVSFQTLYRALQEFEADLHQHIHLENNVLFPRAIAMQHD